MSDYEINEETLAIVPKNAEKSVIHEKFASFVVDKPVNKIMEDSCEYFGSSLTGRQKGTTKLTGISHKAPIIIEETKDVIFFPTTSPRLKRCAWLSLNNIESYYRKKNKLVVEFKNKKKLVFNISYAVIDNQYSRATKLNYVLNQRKNEKS